MRERRMRISIVALVATVATMLAAFVLPGAATSAPPGCKNRTNTTYQQLLTCVTLEGVRAHQAAFQEIADDNDNLFAPGSRAAGTDGYTGSVEYVAGLLEDAGYEVTLDEFDYVFVGALLRQLTPVDERYETGAFLGSGEGETTASVTPVDINLDLTTGRANSSGCEASDFAGFPAGNIALVQRGTCNFGDKAFFAEQAGASAVIIFNQGNTPDREGLIVANASTRSDGTAVQHGIPVVGASFAQGEALADEESTAFVSVAFDDRPQVNVIAEKTGANDDNVVMAGAHLDSVQAGPGINDNGSGSAALLETALMMAKVKPQNTLRFAWWGAEEDGLLGSHAYVDGLSQAEKDRIALYMNYDMVGSPNYIPMVYDADQSTFEAPVEIPDGSSAIEDVYERYYTSIGERYDDTAFSGRSDYEAFILADIPSGGLFTGAEETKTAEQAAIWPGSPGTGAGAQLDPCYHLACDALGNFNGHILGINADLIAFAQLTFAFSTESVNGVPGRAVPGSASMPLPAPAGPAGTFPDQTP
jgi:Zn-dependent M28 family amino/carboxypeptidase